MLKVLTTAAVALLLALGPGTAGAVLVNGPPESDELRIVASDGTVLFSGFVSEGGPESVTSPPFPLAAVLLKAPGFVFLHEPGRPDLGSDQIFIRSDPQLGLFTITLVSDLEVPLGISDPKLEETGLLQDVTGFLFIEAPFKVFVMSDVERVPGPATLLLVALGVLPLGFSLARRRR